MKPKNAGMLCKIEIIIIGTRLFSIICASNGSHLAKTWTESSKTERIRVRLEDEIRSEATEFLDTIIIFSVLVYFYFECQNWFIRTIEILRKKNGLLKNGLLKNGLLENGLFQFETETFNFTFNCHSIISLII